MSHPEPSPDQLVNEWLDAVDRAAADLPDDQRQELLSDLREHIEVTRSTLSADHTVAVRDLLERLGSPTAIVAEARHGMGATPDAARPDVQAPRPDVLAPPHPAMPGYGHSDRPRRSVGWIIVAVVAAAVLCLGGCVVAGMALFATDTVTGQETVVDRPIPARPELPQRSPAP